MVYIIMGVAGCGKTTIGKLLAKKMAMEFHDADDYHSAYTRDKMKNSLPLNDEDRMPWLLELAGLITVWNRNRGAVLACSALKEQYRRVLSGEKKEKVIFILLEGDKKTISERMSRRQKHFFPPALLDSQFSALEVPSDAISVRIEGTPDEICTDIINRLGVQHGAVQCQEELISTNEDS